MPTTSTGGADKWVWPPVDANAVTSQVAPLKTGDTTFSTTDIAGNKTRTIAAWTRRDGRVWFFKATGPTAAVEKEKSNFFDFLLPRSSSVRMTERPC